MPPRFAYWTIIVDNQPTAFRAKEADELLPTFNRLKEKHPSAVMMWFQGGRLWRSRLEAQEAAVAARREEARKKRASRTAAAGSQVAAGRHASRSAAEVQGRAEGEMDALQGTGAARRQADAAREGEPATGAAPAEGGQGVIAHVVLFTPRASLSLDDRRSLVADLGTCLPGHPGHTPRASRATTCPRLCLRQRRPGAASSSSPCSSSSPRRTCTPISTIPRTSRSAAGFTTAQTPQWRRISRSSSHPACAD